MIHDLDIYRSAQILIREHGEDAALEAAMRADAMLEKGDIPMSALGHKRTFSDTLSNVRFHNGKLFPLKGRKFRPEVGKTFP